MITLNEKPILDFLNGLGKNKFFFENFKEFPTFEESLQEEIK